MRRVVGVKQTVIPWALLVAAIVSIAVVREPRSAPSCPVAHRQIVRLHDGDDPRVLLWASVAELRAYQSGRGDPYQSILRTRLLASDAKGVVTAACPTGNRRVVGIMVLSGLHAGASGFVDVRDVQDAHFAH